MIVDSSVLLALLFNEEEAEAFRAALNSSDHCRLAAPSLLEASVVAFARGGRSHVADLSEIVEAFEIEIISFTGQHAVLAFEAYARFGKGQGHPAQLNFGDCMSYALAKQSGEPLLFKGDDFSHTDLVLA